MSDIRGKSQVDVRRGKAGNAPPRQPDIRKFEPRVRYIRLQPNGLHSKISFGNNVSAAKRAINIAAPVNTPKMTVGVKLDIIKMENPKMTVKVV